MVKVRNIPITQSMIAQLKYNVITFNGRLSIPGVAYFLFLLPLFKYFSPKPWKLRGKVVTLQKKSCTRQIESKLSLRSFAFSLRQIRNNIKVKQYGCSYK